MNHTNKRTLEYYKSEPKEEIQCCCQSRVNIISKDVASSNMKIKPFFIHTMLAPARSCECDVHHLQDMYQNKNVEKEAA